MYDPNTDVAAILRTIFHSGMKTNIVLREYFTAIILALEIDSENTIHWAKAEAAFEAAHVTGLAAYDR